MKVLVIGLNYAPEPTGIAPYTTALSEGLAARGHEVHVLTAMPHYPEWRIRAGYGGWSRSEHRHGVAVRRLRHHIPNPPEGAHRLLSELSFGARVVLARWGRPDLVLFVSPALFSTALGILRARVLRPDLPIALWVQDLYSLGVVETGAGSPGGPLAHVMQRVEAAVLRNSSRVVLIHDRFAEIAARLWGGGDRFSVVRNWTHIPAVTSTDETRAATRAALGWRSDETVAVHTGNMGAKQDLGNVVAAARLADAGGLPIRFVLVGDGSERAALEARAAGIRRIDFLDPLPDGEYQRALAAADVLLVNEHAGLRDMALPSKLTSYFSSGRPIVAATDPGSITAAELQASGAGMRVDPADPRALLEAVRSFGGESAQGGMLGKRGLEYMNGVLSQAEAIERFEAVLQGVLSARHAVRVPGRASSQGGA